MWLLVSVFVMVATYLILYWREFVDRSFQLVGLVTSQRSKALRQLAVLKIQSNRLIVSMVALGILGGLSIGTWQISLSSALGPGAKTGVLILIWTPIIACILFLYCKRVRSFGLHSLVRRRRPRPRSFGNR